MEKFLTSQSRLSDEEKKLFKDNFFEVTQKKFLSTKFESPAFFLLLSHIQKIEESASKLSYSLGKRPFFGTAVSKEFNAFAMAVPESDDKIIILEHELFTLANLLVKIIIVSIPELRLEENRFYFNDSRRSIENHIINNPIIGERFNDFVNKAILLGIPTSAKQYNLEDKYITLHHSLLISLELFVVGHEYGHIYAGHLDKGELLNRMINKKGVSIISTDWEMEFEADTIGLNLLLNTDHASAFMPFSILGPEIFFTFLDIYERVQTLVKNGVESSSGGSDTHPPTLERRNHIRGLLRKSIPSEFLHSYLLISGLLESVMEILWESYKRNNFSPIQNPNMKRLF